MDNAGTVRLWETGAANLERSLQEWRRMIGDEVAKLKFKYSRDGRSRRDPVFQSSRDVTLRRDFDPGQLNDIDPKHGKVDPSGAPHVGGNTWAGGVGGRGTAGLGGVGGPYRLDAGHDVFQVRNTI